MRKHGGIKVQKFKVAQTPDEARKAAYDLGVNEIVLKAQILAGGRGEGKFSSGLKGGVQVTRDLESISDLSKKMIGNHLITEQTPPKGVLVKKVMIAEALDIERETYLAIVMDSSKQGPMLLGSPEGGVDIEEVAKTNPEKIFKVPVDIMEGLTREKSMKLSADLEFKGKSQEEAAKQIEKLYDLFLKVDATQVEINPFVETPDGKVICFDAKIVFDDNAEFRQKEIFAQEDTNETDPHEVKAAKYNLNYIGMDGNIGCLVNGAGLAMATMDIIKLHGGKPANFLDVGGGVTEEQVLNAFKLLTDNPEVKCILVNVFGGIVNCATIANGIIQACKQISLEIPLVVRLEGTNAEKARELLQSSGLQITPASDLKEATVNAVSAVSKVN